ncbi:hypothetical protein BB561_003588 [Smittium simulii]|uniref:Kinesin motor domain-containing protein n=1 Tax=Smittium simulii TaxID=133385 RepID=A0A2T9YKI6_9FUNG|nr:hypothetical protein BB561_003588 [Smittium simulii]
MKDNINVAIRIRPQTEKEETSFASSSSAFSWAINENTISQVTKTDSKAYLGTSYTFDKVYNQDSKTHEIYYGAVDDIVKSAMNGINATVFAYGQTSSGKTHTMYGKSNEAGIINLAIREVFDHIEKNNRRQFIVRMSYLEIYNEIVSDLLDPNRKNLKISENANASSLTHLILFTSL